MGSKPNTKPWWRWQFSLQALVVVFTLLGFLFAYFSHFRRLTLQSRAHLDEAQRRLDWGLQMGRVTFRMPQQYWVANEADREWHTAKAQECLRARWFPWREVDESTIPPLTQGEDPWPNWTTEWRSARK